MGRGVGIFVLVVIAALTANEAHARNRSLTKAQKAYENLDYERVTPLLNRALKGKPTDEEKQQIFFLLGTMHTIYGRDQQAKDSFVQLLELSPDFELPPDTSPKIAEAFEQARGTRPVAQPEPEPEPEPESEPAPKSGPMGATDPLLPEEIRTTVDDAVYEKWWFWTGVAVVIAGGVALTYTLMPAEYPPHDFGPYPLK